MFLLQWIDRQTISLSAVRLRLGQCALCERQLRAELNSRSSVKTLAEILAWFSRRSRRRRCRRLRLGQVIFLSLVVIVIIRLPAIGRRDSSVQKTSLAM